MDTAREVSWHLLIGNLYKWKYKEFLLLFESANEQTPPPKEIFLIILLSINFFHVL